MNVCGLTAIISRARPPALAASVAFILAIGPATAADLGSDAGFIDPTPSGAAIGGAPPTQWSVQSFGTFVHFKSNRTAERGTQFINTVEASVSHLMANDLRLRFAAKTGYLYSDRRVLAASGTHRGLTDTSTRAQAVYEGFATFQPFVSLDLNLPTGRETLAGRRRLALMDRDLVPITRFGEGWNVNPAIGVSVPIGPNLSATLAVGHNVRGYYTPDQALGDRYDPGDQTIGTLGVTYADDRWFVAGNVIVTREGVSRINGVSLFEPGLGFIASLRGSYKWTEAHVTTAHVLYNSTGRNKSLDPFIGQFQRDAQNANSDLVVLASSHEYALTPIWRLFGAAEYLNRSKNSFDPATLEFIPAKERVMVEGGVRMVLPQGFEGSVSYGQYILRQDATQLIPEAVYRGHVARFALSAKF